jgi:hypothetical protein
MAHERRFSVSNTNSTPLDLVLGPPPGGTKGAESTASAVVSVVIWPQIERLERLAAAAELADDPELRDRLLAYLRKLETVLEERWTPGDVERLLHED